jgi:predicted alpha/beta-hydrolase family hydrolase
MASLVKYAGSRDTGSPKPPSNVATGLQACRSTELELCRYGKAAETVGGHAQKKGVLEDYGRLIKTHEL